MNTTQNDTTVREYTAFDSFAELKAAMAAGYCPTIHTSRQAPLAALLNTNGLQFFPIR